MEMDISIFEAFEQNPDEDEEEVESFPIPQKKVKIESLEEDGSREDGPVQDSTVSKITEFVGEDIFSDFVEIHRLPRIKVHKLNMVDFCVHEVAISPHMEFTPLKQPTSKPAKEYKFTLDPFQKEAILYIDNKQSVLVSAHTSAGKTVVAEYSIATSLRDQQKVVYTTPIKAPSNQKYREFQEEFQDVGLVTGDVTININASCLVMTMEGQFQEQNFNASMNMLMNAGDAAKGDQKGRRGGFVGNTGESNIYKIVRMIMERHFAPVIVFNFSKKECETYALQMAKLDFSTETEKGLVDEVFNNAIQVLSEPDRKLLQVEYILPLLR